MSALTICIILLSILILFAALLALPVRMELTYDGDALTMTGQLGPVSLPLMPRPGKGRPRERWLTRLLWENGGEAIYKVIGSLHIEYLRVRFTAGGPDPYDAAMAYAHMGAALEALDHFAAGRIEQTDLRAEVDFGGGDTVLDSCMRLRAHLFHVLRAGFCFGTGFLRGYSQKRHPKTKG